jgi:hypothetical protein
VFNVILFLLFNQTYAYNLEECRKNSETGTTIPFDSNGKFFKECAPDTLYSWQPARKVQQLARESSSRNILPIEEELFFWRTPAGTFAYGDMAMRVKLKPNAKFVLIDRVQRDKGCDYLTQSFQKDAIFVHYFFKTKGSEYILCSDKSVDSWSYGTQTHLDEIKTEVAFIDCQNGNWDNVDRYWSNKKDSGRFGFTVDTLFPFPLSVLNYASPWTNSTLIEHINNIEKIIEKSEGYIFESEDAKKNKRDHFHTETGQYYTN